MLDLRFLRRFGRWLLLLMMFEQRARFPDLKYPGYKILEGCKDDDCPQMMRCSKDVRRVLRLLVVLLLVEMFAIGDDDPGRSPGRGAGRQT